MSDVGPPEGPQLSTDGTQDPQDPDPKAPAPPPQPATPDGIPLGTAPVDGLAKPPGARRRGRRLTKPEELSPGPLTPAQMLLILDTWRRSGLPARDFAPLVGVSRHTLYAWKQRFEKEGPGGLEDHPRGTVRGTRLPDLTQRAILMLREANPDYGCERISNLLARGPALAASPNAEAGYVFEENLTRPHPDYVREFERARANQLWQTDFFTFVLKWQNRRVYRVVFLDDHSRFVVSFSVHGRARRYTLVVGCAGRNERPSLMSFLATRIASNGTGSPRSSASPSISGC
jgi:hypothetical protein